MEKLTKKQLISKHKGKYVNFIALPLWDTNSKGEQLFEVREVYKNVHEDTALVTGTGFTYEHLEPSTKETFTFDFYGSIEVEAETREEAIDLLSSDNTHEQCEEVNGMILENVNFNF